MYQTYRFESHKNGSEKYIFFEFVSDGNYQSHGFEIKFTELFCECGDKELSCTKNYNEYGILKNQGHHYCGNMECSFTIIPCESEYMLLKMYSMPFDFDGSIKILSNNITSFETKQIPQGSNHGDVYLKSSNQNSIQIITIRKDSLNRFSLVISPFEIPPVNLNIILTPENPTHIFDTYVYPFVVVEVMTVTNPENVSIILYQNVRNFNTPIFLNESLTTNIMDKHCTSVDRIRCVVPSKKLATFAPKDSDSTIIAVRLSKNFGQCVFDENIYYPRGINFYVSAIASLENDCTVTILLSSSEFYYITDLWTSSSIENVTVYIGKNQKYFEFNKNTEKIWKNIGLFSSYYTVKIPKGETIWMKLYYYTSKINLFHPSKSIIATPYYITGYKETYDSNFVSYFIGNNSVKFTVMDYKMPENFDFYFLINNDTKIQINGTGDYYVFKNQLVRLHYKIPFSETRVEHGILFDIEIFNDAKDETKTTKLSLQ